MQLSKSDRMLFDKLTEDRKQTVKALKKSRLLDVFISHIVDTYRESAHFIYELLQNADDANATTAKIELFKDKIIFYHNGDVSFSISDCDLEGDEGVTPGHINSITLFSLSTKKTDIENKIGKFGIGFKSVFQYTELPKIYNPPFCFEIQDYLVPFQIPVDLNLFKSNETTVFVIPFDKKEKPAGEAYSEISKKLESLKNPLLFLKKLLRIEIISEDYHQIFTKESQEVLNKWVSNAKIDNVTLNDDTILKFERDALISDSKNAKYILPISVAFIIEKGKIVSSSKFAHYFKYAWCFFPTSQATELNYIINAPFVLTPDRDSLKENKIENKQLIDALSLFIGDAIQCLKHLGYLNEEFFITIPIPKENTSEFRIIAEKVISKLKNGEFIPTKEGSHVAVKNAYVCTENPLSELLVYKDHLPLQKLTNNPLAKIVFTERKLFSNQNLFVFFYQNLAAVSSDLNAAWLGGQYSKSFIDGMPEEFVSKFFKYLIERSNSILGKNQPLWNKPFIPIQSPQRNFDLIAPNNKKGEPQVFIGGAKLANRYVVKEFLSDDPEIRAFMINVLRFRIPNEFDDFFISLEKYSDKDHSVPLEEAVSDFFTALDFYQKVSKAESAKLISRLKELFFIIYSDKSDEYGYINPSKLVTYYPTKELKKYFEYNESGIIWIAIDKYFNNNPIDDNSNAFLQELHVQFLPYYWSSNSEGRKNVLHGIEEFIANLSLETSVYLIEVLQRRGVDYKGELMILKEKPWLFDEDGIKRVPNEIFSGHLHKSYSIYANNIHLALGAKVEIKDDRYASLNATEKDLLESIMPSLKELSTEEVKEAIAQLLRNKNSRKSAQSDQQKESEFADPTTPNGLVESWSNEPVEKNNKRNRDEVISGNVIPSIPNTNDFWNDEPEDSFNVDNPGGYISGSIIGNTYKQKKESNKKQQMEKEIERESKRNKLIELASEFEPYSFGWFKTLLELEDSFVSEDRVKHNPIRVVFNKAELDVHGLLVLSDTVYIPPTIEEMGELAIQLISGDDKRTIIGEVVSPKKQVLYIKLSNPDQLNGIELEKVSSIIVEGSSPDFILEKLKRAFARLPLSDTDNLKNPSLLPKELNFVFGPPGTGKTTYLSWLIGGKNPDQLQFGINSVTPFMEQENKRVLVLTPTNKAADVLSQRILKNYEDTNDYPAWLIRFGQTQTLENDPIFVGDRKVKPWIYEKSTLITTIARFPYDYFKIESKNELTECQIKDFNWDIIIFDEASMIHQSALLYVVFYAKQINPNITFYIGGDPFQIPPITIFEFPHWSYLPELAIDNDGNPILDEKGQQMFYKQDGGNIYSFVGLMSDDSFINPVTLPHSFIIHNLNRQFRSVVPIGALFSHYRYNGKLQHYRTKEAITNNKRIAAMEIEIPNLPLPAITIIRFPVKKYEGVYRVRTIKGSPYQLYSSIFSVELIKYIQTNARIQNGATYKIGIISPYAIQSNIISKLLNKISSNSIEIIAGTVHGFQGDECNLVIVVLNPPKYITRNARTFLNKKNILNVAISRAKDKMIILTPFDPVNEINTDDLHQIKTIIRLAGTIPECKDDVVGYESYSIENQLWGSPSYIEDSTFSTTHQNVNIYGKQTRKYEVRQDENAIDFQVNPDFFG